ncbi:hypothetical protein [Rariglobus hedericola]|uniref:Nucleotidyl transferase AbiEii/AbiGii toxin family protein n=1 Tax=Rariglobus hedericola TaxID=2597822 RepID=A0A556QJD5_9BACT|nr:hypothetical protein [Rariglobus hedericola]TSJ76764.1 hypothetical protein FPL22_11605 [Rariglobus hedericola]
MARTQLRPVEDFDSIFRAISKQKELVILVGGHAVNVWALSYHDRLGDLLAPLRPFTSGDMDVYATRHALMQLHEDLGGKLLLSGPREITDGTLIIGVEPDTRELDVLRSVNGLPKLDAQSAIPLEVCGHAVPVLFPHLLLQAKLENALRLDQRYRQDIKHVKIMALVLREFLQQVVTTTTAENEKYALQLLQKVLAILISDNAREFTRLHKVSFDTIMPVELISGSPLRKLANFGQKELPRALAVSASQKTTPKRSR